MIPDSSEARRVVMQRPVYIMTIKDFYCICEHTKRSRKLTTKCFMDQVMPNIRWSLIVYPNGCNLEYKNFLGIGIGNFGDQDVEANIKLSLLDANEHVLFQKMVDNTLYPKNHYIGVADFLSRNILMNPANAFLWDGQLRIGCEIEMVRVASNTAQRSDFIILNPFPEEQPRE